MLKFDIGYLPFTQPEINISKAIYKALYEKNQKNTYWCAVNYLFLLLAAIPMGLHVLTFVLTLVELRDIKETFQSMILFIQEKPYFNPLLPLALFGLTLLINQYFFVINGKSIHEITRERKDCLDYLHSLEYCDSETQKEITSWMGVPRIKDYCDLVVKEEREIIKAEADMLRKYYKEIKGHEA